jgi:hypothetical protein
MTWCVFVSRVLLFYVTIANKAQVVDVMARSRGKLRTLRVLVSRGKIKQVYHREFLLRGLLFLKKW